MKIHSLVNLIAVTVVTCGLAAGCASDKQKEAKLKAKAKVTRAQAEKIALERVPNGTIKEANIEKEHGKVIWSFDLATPGTADITEVAVDAITGQVVSVDKETPAQEDKEKKEEKEKTEK